MEPQSSNKESTNINSDQADFSQSPHHNHLQ